jgi:hypothetical protein
MARFFGGQFSQMFEKVFCHRRGSEQTLSMVDSAKVFIHKPRVRRNAKEVESLKIYCFEKLLQVRLTHNWQPSFRQSNSGRCNLKNLIESLMRGRLE